MPRKGLALLTATGNTNKTERFLKKMGESNFVSILHEYGRKGVELLSMNTPVDSGVTAASWTYTIDKSASGYKLYWNNTSMADNIPIVILIQYGHVTKNGGYVAPNDFINPVIDHVYDELSNRLRKEMKS